MKLNMWMIANRLENYEIQMDLDPVAPAVLNSALPVYIPGCVRISADGPDVVCEHDREWIRICDISLSDGYMLIQSIFDWYQDWMDRMDQAVMRGRFQDLAKECSRGFGDNPVMLQDSNYRLLSMYEKFAPGDMPLEWQYILENGQSSVEGYSFMVQALTHSTGRYLQNVRSFLGRKNAPVDRNGLHAPISFQGREYGKLTILEYRRPMNLGDIRVLEYLSRRMSIYNAAISGFTKKFLDPQTLEALVAGQTVAAEKVSFFQSLMENGKSGQFSMQTIQFSDPARSGDRHALQLLKNIIGEQHPDTASCIYQDSLVLLLYFPNPTALAEQVFQFIENCGYSGQLRAGLSLPFRHLEDTGFFYHQSAAALRSGRTGVTKFYDLAVPVLLNSSGQERLLACEPFLRRIWEDEPEKREMLESLAVYLDTERSCTQAAARMFVHKNTLTYRIRSLKDQTGWNLDDSYVRNYLRLSLYCLGSASGPPQ